MAGNFATGNIQTYVSNLVWGDSEGIGLEPLPPNIKVNCCIKVLPSTYWDEIRPQPLEKGWDPKATEGDLSSWHGEQSKQEKHSMNLVMKSPSTPFIWEINTNRSYFHWWIKTEKETFLTFYLFVESSDLRGIFLWEILSLKKFYSSRTFIKSSRTSPELPLNASGVTWTSMEFFFFLTSEP